ncbi:MAG TPA: GNAT family N-acetyltransferase [Gemmataceae bacterium]|jgi:RimJ/RimL family protein N-acetyltransferase|nr:GNAT family N-acetyltransferase [Gemmataceae bacterium]
MFDHDGLVFRKIERHDLDDLLELKQESWRWRHRTSLLNSDDQLRWYESLGDSDTVLVAMHAGKSIGIFKIFGIDWHSRAAEVGWDVFAPVRGQGWGKRIVKAGVAFCFEVLNLWRLDCEVLADNVRSIRCAEVAGFRLEGRKRARVRREGRTIDSLVYGALAADVPTTQKIDGHVDVALTTEVSAPQEIDGNAHGALATDVSTTPRINYVIAAWSGPRRDVTLNPVLYLDNHIRSLQVLPHSLTQITVVVPDDPDEPASFAESLARLPASIGTARVEIIRRPNIGLSYGSYSEAYGRYRQAFDYYIFIEDDYVFVQENFDRLLVDMRNARPDCGLLCALVTPLDGIDHGALAHGIADSATLEDIWCAFGEIPHAAAEPHYSNSHQIDFTRAFMLGGRRLYDVTDRFHIIYNHVGTWQTFGDTTLPLLMQPIDNRPRPAPLTVLILLLYHERPEMVRNALRSVLRAGSQYPHWEVAFIDDRSQRPGEPIARAELDGYLDRVRFYTIAPDGLPESSVGKYMNQAIADSAADIALMLCDDDELVCDYLANLNGFFAAHPNEWSCYSSVHLYNPAWQDSRFVDNVIGPLNVHTGRINPAGQVDASQVAWRTAVNKELGAWFEYPRTACLDEAFYRLLAEKTGDTPFSGFVGQYKGIHPGQLTYGPTAAAEKRIDAPDVRRATPLNDVLITMGDYRDLGNEAAVAQMRTLALETFPMHAAEINAVAGLQ